MAVYMPTDTILCEDAECRVEATLDSVQLTAAIDGTGAVLVLTSFNDGYRITKVPVSYVAGDNTLMVGIMVPVGGLVGFITNTANAIYADASNGVLRYREWVGYPVDDLLPSYSYPPLHPNQSGVFRLSSNIQLRHNLTRNALPIHPSQYLTDDDLVGTAGPVSAWGDAWEKAGNTLINNDVGLTNSLKWASGFTFHRNLVFSLEIEFSAAASSLYVFRQPELGGQGTIFSLDMADNSITLYESLNADAVVLPAVYDSKICSFPFLQGRQYRVALVKSYYTHKLVVTDLGTQVTDELVYDGYIHSSTAGLCYGEPRIAMGAGSLIVRDLKVSSPIRAARALLLGDSIMEGTGTTQANGWAYLAQQAVPAMVSARGGDTSSAVLYRCAIEAGLYASLKYAVVDIGTNDLNMTDWQSNIDLIAETMETYGLTPVFCTMLADGNTNMTAIQNPYIRANYRFIDMAVALSIGGDGVTFDPSLFAGPVHPNTAGHLAMFNQAQADLPELFA